MNKVTSLKHLNTILDDKESHDFYILLTGGIVSRKTVRKSTSVTYAITNHIDDSHQSLTEDELFDENITHIGIALKKGALIELH